MEPQTHLKRDVANRVVEGSIVAMLNIRKAFIPCMLMLGVVRSKDMHTHLVDDTRPSIGLRVEGSRFG